MVHRSVEIVEVSPRDGLQSEDTILDARTKIELITRAVDAGIRRVEVCSFVNPKRVPQMADAEEVLAGLPARDDVTYIGLVLNQRGFERAVEAGLKEINVVAITTETFAQRNQGTTSEGTVAAFEAIAPLAIEAGIRPTLTVSASFGCPYEGEVPVERVVEIARRGAEAGAAEIALADSIGAAVPTDVTERLRAAREVIGGTALRAHFHNTRNTGLANAYAAVEVGVDALDASLGGIGGCPFAPNATGNIPTEDLVYLLDRMGVDTGLDLQALADVVPWIETQLGKRVPGLLSKAGLFPAA
ncbi:MAG TPA: hydroxymethylglutaryl-CoA lyase [Acidimicrobiales bacterium]|nr:hydroxymethylglutaryl-CoA lyase [Acidimicrobiales bacterium]